MKSQNKFFRTTFFLFLLACLLIGLAGVVRVSVQAAPLRQGSMEVIINEVAWAGTIASEDDDWIELYNPNTAPVDISGWQLISASGSLNIIFNPGTTINGDTYFLIETREAATSAPADFIPPYPWSLGNAGDTIRLRKTDGSIVDTVNEDGGPWPGGDLASHSSMERYRPLPDSDAIWTTYNGSSSSATDAANHPVNGTPGSRNWAYDVILPTVTTITADSPDPSLVGQNVTVTVKVTSPLSIPTGTVNITVQNLSPKCTITLSNGTGSCVLSFGSVGTKVIQAAYVPPPGDLDHKSSTATATHEVRISSTTTIVGVSPSSPQTYESVTITALVEGDSNTAPTGTVSITGASVNCQMTLSENSDLSASGACIVRFYSSGSKVITATYSGDSRYVSSIATTTVTVRVTPTATPYKYRTPTPLPLPPPPLVGINEFVPRPGHDWNNDGVINTGDEFIELINFGVIDVNLSGYALDDEANIGSSPYRLPPITIKPGQRIVFYGSQTGLHLDDGGDGVRLLKPNGQLADAYNYTVVRYPDESYCRLPDNGGLDDWNQNCFPTPGLQNSLNGNFVQMPGGNAPLPDDQASCPYSDTFPLDFALAECPSFGNIWNSYYWDKDGWYGDRNIPSGNSEWDSFVN